jgi:hypothetical protein
MASFQNIVSIMPLVCMHCNVSKLVLSNQITRFSLRQEDGLERVTGHRSARYVCGVIHPLTGEIVFPRRQSVLTDTSSAFGAPEPIAR